MNAGPTYTQQEKLHVAAPHLMGQAAVFSGNVEAKMSPAYGQDAVHMSRLRTLAEFRFQMRKFLSFTEAASERVGVAAQQYQLMQVIAAMPDGQRASIGYLAERMILRHNSMVELVDRAERAGLVRREHDERDLRRSLVLLTPFGEEVLHRLVTEHLKELAPKCEQLMRALEELKLAGEPLPLDS